MFRFIGLACVGALLSGCALVNATRIDSAGIPVKSEDGFQSVDLALALDPTGQPSVNPNVAKCIQDNGVRCSGIGSNGKMASLGVLTKSLGARDSGEDADEVVERLRLETAYFHFYNSDLQPGQKLEDRRNRVQQRLIGASDMNCGIFTQRIYGIQATGNFTLGSVATGLGGAGAIVTQVNTARLLSGLSAIASGVRAEMNEDFFRKQWIEALVKAIETERSRLRGEIESRASERSISQYPVEAAVADAIRYNDACSLVSGLKEVNRAVAIADDPAGLRAFRDIYKQAGFDANFSATVTSMGASTSSRLPFTTATATVALAEIGRAVAEASATAATSKSRIKGLGLTEAVADTALREIDEKMTNLQSSAGYGSGLSSFTTPLAKYQDEYVKLSMTLAGAENDARRLETSELMRANDASAEVLRRAARDVVVRTERDIVATVDNLAAAH